MNARAWWIGVKASIPRVLAVLSAYAAVLAILPRFWPTAVHQPLFHIEVPSGGARGISTTHVIFCLGVTQLVYHFMVGAMVSFRALPPERRAAMMVAGSRISESIPHLSHLCRRSARPLLTVAKDVVLDLEGVLEELRHLSERLPGVLDAVGGFDVVACRGISEDASKIARRHIDAHMRCKNRTLSAIRRSNDVEPFIAQICKDQGLERSVITDVFLQYDPQRGKSAVLSMDRDFHELNDWLLAVRNTAEDAARTCREYPEDAKASLRQLHDLLTVEIEDVGRVLADVRAVVDDMGRRCTIQKRVRDYPALIDIIYEVSQARCLGNALERYAQAYTLVAEAYVDLPSSFLVRKDLEKDAMRAIEYVLSRAKAFPGINLNYALYQVTGLPEFREFSDGPVHLTATALRRKLFGEGGASDKKARVQRWLDPRQEVRWKPEVAAVMDDSEPNSSSTSEAETRKLRLSYATSVLVEHFRNRAVKDSVDRVRRGLDADKREGRGRLVLATTGYSMSAMRAVVELIKDSISRPGGGEPSVWPAAYSCFSGAQDFSNAQRTAWWVRSMLSREFEEPEPEGREKGGSEFSPPVASWPIDCVPMSAADVGALMSPEDDLVVILGVEMWDGQGRAAISAQRANQELISFARGRALRAAKSAGRVGRTLLVMPAEEYKFVDSIDRSSYLIKHSSSQLEICQLDATGDVNLGPVDAFQLTEKDGSVESLDYVIFPEPPRRRSVTERDRSHRRDRESS